VQEFNVELCKRGGLLCWPLQLGTRPYGLIILAWGGPETWAIILSNEHWEKFSLPTYVIRYLDYLILAPSPSLKSPRFLYRASTSNQNGGTRASWWRYSYQGHASGWAGTVTSILTHCLKSSNMASGGTLFIGTSAIRSGWYSGCELASNT